jgi:hypothetical protein
MKRTAIISTCIVTSLALVVAVTKANEEVNTPNNVILAASDTRTISINLGDSTTLSQFSHVEFTDLGSVKSQVDNTINQSEYITRDSDLVISMPLIDIFEHSYIQGGDTETYTINQVSQRNNGEVHGDVTVVSGRDSSTTALYFDNNTLESGKHSYVYSPLSGLNLKQVRQTGYSYSAWIKPASLTGTQAIAASGPYYKITNSLYLTSDKIAFQYKSDQGNGAQVVGTTPLNLDQWYHIAGVYDPYAQEIKVYLNGQLEASGSAVEAGPFSHMDHALDLYVGNAAGNKNDFTGSISELKVFTRPLSNEYVADTYADTFYTGSIISQQVDLAEAAGYNRIKLNTAETNAGTSQVYVWQNAQWQRLYSGVDMVFDMPAREPLSKLQYKIDFNGQTELTQLSFELTNQNYTPEPDSFSFMFMGDDNAPTSANGPAAIADAFNRVDDVELIFSIPDNGFYPLSEFHKRYNQAILKAVESKTTGKTLNTVMPFFIGMGNHDIEKPDSVDHAVKFLSPRVPFSLPGMSNYREGPFDTYANGETDKGLTYSFDYKNTHFVMLNGYFRDLALGQDRFSADYSPIAHVSEELLAWLEETLSYTTAQHKFIFFHEGAFPPPGARHRGDSLDAISLPGNNGANNTRPMRDRLWTLLAKYNVTATLMGHNHTPSQTWIADPSGQYDAVYELEPGMLKSSTKYALVKVTNEQATVKFIGTSNFKHDFYQTHDDVIINRNGTLANQPPKLFQHSAAIEKGYPVIEKTEINVEVGQSIVGKNALYFEAKDQNIHDLLTFSYANLPAFMQINDEAQFRRVYLTTAELPEQEIGLHPFSVMVSDGTLTDEIQLTVNILPTEKPQVIGSTIIDGSIVTQFQYADFICHDNAKAQSGRTYNHFEVNVNGEMLDVSNWAATSSQIKDEMLLESIYFKNPDSLPFGDYQISAHCYDALDLKSDNYVLNFRLVDDGIPLSETVPWIRGVWPNADKKHAAIDRISIFPHALRGGNLRALAEGTSKTVEFIALDGEAVSYTVKTSYSDKDVFGVIDVVFDQVLADGRYQLKVTPKYTSLSGKPHVFDYEVDTTSTDNSTPSAPASIGGQALTASSVQISWAAATDDWGVAKYQVLRDGSLVATVSATSQHSYIDTGLDAQTSYRYEVRALDASGNQGSSVEIYIVTLDAVSVTVPDAPSSLVVQTKSLTWSDNADNEDGYRLEYRLYNDSNFQLLIALDANTVSYIHETQANNAYICYRVSAFNSAGTVSSSEFCIDNTDSGTGTGSGGDSVEPGDGMPPTDTSIIMAKTVSRPFVIDLAGRKFRSFANNVYGNLDGAVQGIGEPVFDIGAGTSKIRASSDYQFSQDGVVQGDGYVSMSYNQANSVTIPLEGDGQSQTAKIYLKAGAWSDDIASFTVTAGDETQIIQLPRSYAWLSFEVNVNFTESVDIIIQPNGVMGGYSHFYVAGVVLDNLTLPAQPKVPLISAEITAAPGQLAFDDVEFYSFAQGVHGNEPFFSSEVGTPSITLGSGSLRSTASAQYEFFNNGILVDTGYSYFSYNESNRVTMPLKGNSDEQLASIYIKAGAWSEDIASFTVTAGDVSKVFQLPTTYRWFFYRIDIKFTEDMDVTLHPNNAHGGYSAFALAAVTLKQLNADPITITSSTYYIDGSLAVDCQSQYNVATRNCGTGADTAYRSLAGGASNVKPGDTVLIRQGVYNETLIPGQSGTADAPIFFGRYGSEQVTITNVSGAGLAKLPEGEHADIAWEKFGFYLWNKSHITIDGLTIDNVNGWGRAVNASYITLSNNEFTNATTPGGRGSIKFVMGGHNKILNNKIHTGNDNIYILKSDYNVIAGNEITSGRHSLWTIKGGNYNVVRGNYFHNNLEKIGEIFDAFDPVHGLDEIHFGLSQKNATKHNLVEDNIFAYTPSSGTQAPYSGIQYAAQEGVIRNNVFYDITGSGIEIASYYDEAEFSTDNRIYNNVFYQNHFSGMLISRNEAYYLSNNIMKNNVFYQNDFIDHDGRFSSWQQLDGYATQIITRTSAGAVFDNNAVFGSAKGDNYVIANIFPNDDDNRGPEHYSLAGAEQVWGITFVDNLEVDPGFSNAAAHDFSLTASSPLIDSGDYFTRTVDAGEGNRLVVSDVRYFYDGFTIPGENADTIQLENSGDTATVVSIDYQQNTLILDKALQWSQGQGVSLIYTGSAPDIGAFER